MDLRQLHALIAVGEQGSFSAAAKALFTVQSNVSAHIARLERELGVTLVDRLRGTLTAEGELVVDRARRVEHELTSMRTDLASFGAELTGEVRLGVIGTTARWLIPRVLTEMREAHPKVRNIVVEGNTTSLMPQLLSAQVDMAVVNLPIDDAELIIEPLFDEDLVLIAPADHPLADRDRVSLDQLAPHPMFMLPPGTALREDLDNSCRKVNVKLVPLAEIDGVRLVASLAFSGAGPAIVPASAVPNVSVGPWRRVEIDGLTRRQVALARRSRALLSAPARAVADIVHSTAEIYGPDQPGVYPPGHVGDPSVQGRAPGAA
ncbi:MAG: LysR family transcriptional regulator [Acidimicrobiia bacterium]